MKLKKIAVAKAALLAAALAVSAAGVQAQEQYPSGTITLLVAWGAGGATDLMARALQPALAEELGVDIVIKNVSGAAGTIGTAEAARANHDGHTVLISPAGPMTVQTSLRQLPYTLESFRAVGRVSMAPMVMMVAPDSSYNTFADLVGGAKAAPGQVSFASVGAGSLPHLGILAVANAADIELKHVPFQGSGKAMTALLGGTVDGLNDQAQLVPQYELKALAAFSSERLPELPDVPTLKELGYDVEMSNWIGIFVPAEASDEVVSTLNSALNTALENQEVIAVLDNLAVTPAPGTPEEFAEFTVQNQETNRALLKDAGLLQ